MTIRNLTDKGPIKGTRGEMPDAANGEPDAGKAPNIRVLIADDHTVVREGLVDHWQMDGHDGCGGGTEWPGSR